MRSVLTSALALVAITTVIFTSPGFAQVPNIEGNYRIVSRTLKDGTVLKPPEIIGLQTYTKQYRNFNFTFKNTEGKIVSRSQISTYSLTPTDYIEDNVFHLYVVGGQIQDVPNEKIRSKVTVEGPRISYSTARRQVVHEAGGFTSTSPNDTDVWEKIQ
jgi:hypothetical protein